MLIALLLTLPPATDPPAPAPRAAAVAPLSPLRLVHAFAAVGRYAAGDRGVDLAGLPGQQVRSATAGVVTFAGQVAGQGVLSVRIGDGTLLTYEPVRPTVRAGAAVTSGEPIGRLDGGHRGCPAAACLHWGLRRPDGTYADPLALLGPTQVRLLPLGVGAVGTRAEVRSVGVAPPTRSRRSSRSAAGRSGLPLALGTAGIGAGAVTLARRSGARRRRPGYLGS